MAFWRELKRAVFRTSPAFAPSEKQQTEVLIDNVIGSGVIDGRDRDSLERDRELLRQVIRGEITADQAVTKIMNELVEEGIVPADWEKRGSCADDSLASDP